MASDSWSSRMAATSRRFQFQHDLHDDSDVDDDAKVEVSCPFCAEDFDLVALYFHIEDDHPVETKHGVCPVCSKWVGADIVSHITMQHGSFFKGQRNRRLRKGGGTNSNVPFSAIRKEFQDGSSSFKSLLGGGSSSSFVSSPNTDPDPLLASFMFSPPLLRQHHDDPPRSHAQSHPKNAAAEPQLPPQKIHPPPPLTAEEEDKFQKCEFVQSLLLSTILD